MKKTAITLALASFCFANVALAGPFADVPTKHWSYTAVSKLAQDGIIDGYGDKNFNGDKAITRYEMAVFVAKAMERTDKASAEDKALINKLSTEYGSELKNLGVRVDTLEKKSEKVSIWGFIHMSDQVFRNSGDFKGASTTAGDTFYKNDGHYPVVGTDIYFTYKVNDRWNVKVEEEAVRGMRSGGYSGGFVGSSADGDIGTSQHAGQMYAEGSMGKTAVKFGKFDYAPGYGLVLAASRKAVNGVQFTFGDQFKTTASFGYIRNTWTGNPLNPYLVSGNGDNRYAAIEFNDALSPTSNLKAAYHTLSNDKIEDYLISDNIRIWEVGADTMLSKDLNLFASYAKSNADTLNKAYMIGLTKGRADLNTPGTSSVTARYIKADAYSSMCPDNYWIGTYGVAPSAINGFSDIGTYGLKGPELNVQYILDKNVGAMIWASSLKPTDGRHSGKLNTIKTEIDFFF